VWFISDYDVDPYRSCADANSYGDIYTYSHCNLYADTHTYSDVHCDCNRYRDIHAHIYFDASRKRAPLPYADAYANSNPDFDATTDTGSSNSIRCNRCNHH
jgi:hypothetical protein